ncbi:MAG: acyl carrier protein [Peptostreptococcaceae bacterium]|jgi:acyl carrier protein|nr:acyl carrier protein [Peptostreptococcaceae bacterium]
MMETIKTIISDQMTIDMDSIDLNSDLKQDLEIDSLDAVEIMMSIEDEFDIKIEDEQIMQFKKIKDIIDYIENYN